MLFKFNLFVIFFMLASSSFAQQEQRKRHPESNTDSTLIVIFPFFQREFDTSFFAAFSQSRFRIADTAQISHNLLNHELFNSTSRKVVESVSRGERNLYIGISKHEIDDFKANTLYSDIILIHLKIKGITIEKNRGKKIKKLQGDIFAYNLKSGEFLLRCSPDSEIKFYDEAEGSAYAIKKFAEDAVDCFSSRLK